MSWSLVLTTDCYTSCAGSYDIDNTVFTLMPVQRVAVVGSSIELTCSAVLPLLSTTTCVDNNCVTIMWTNDTMIFNGSETYSVIGGSLSISETIDVNSLSLTDSGSYQCRITHDTQSNTRQFILVVTG